MRRLLHVDASPREDRSRSRPVANAFLEALARREVAPEVERLDLWEVDLPELGGGMIEGRYSLIMGEEVEPAIADAWREVRGHATHFLSFDGVLISTPMWNFGLPYRLKHWIDVVTQPGMAFTNDAQGNVEGGAAHMKAMVVAASAIPFGKDDAVAPLDFQLAYLTAWMDFIGLREREVMRVSPTFGTPEDVERTVDEAAARAVRIASRF